MNRAHEDRVTWVLVALFAIAGFLLRLRLDAQFDKMIITGDDGKRGMFRSLVLEPPETMIEEEGGNE